MKILKKCSCGESTYTKDELIEIIKQDIRPWYKSNNTDILGFVFDCDKCHSSMLAKVEVIEIDLIDLIDTKETKQNG